MAGNGRLSHIKYFCCHRMGRFARECCEDWTTASHCSQDSMERDAGLLFPLEINALLCKCYKATMGTLQ